MAETRSSSSASDDDEVPAPIQKANTMHTTAKEGLALIKDAGLLYSSRSGTKAVKQVLDASVSEAAKVKKRKAKKLSKPPQMKRDTTMKATVKEAKVIFGKKTGSAKAARQLRKDSKKQEAMPKVKRDDTMTKTAKEGKEFLGQKFLHRMKDTS